LFISKTAAQQLVTQYEQKLSGLQTHMEELFRKYPELKDKQQSILQRHALYAQHEAVEVLIKADIISNEVAEQEQSQIIEGLVKLEE
jgi:CPA1 family monovalent cation:H+ antiporter